MAVLSARRRFVLALAAIALVAMLGLVGHAAPALADAGSQSVAYQLDPGHDGFASGVSLAPPLSHAWSDTLSGGISYPVIVGDQVFVTAAAGNGTNVYAINRLTGAIEWHKPIAGTYPWSGIAYDVSGGAARLFVVNYDGLLTALDPATGTSLWSFQLPGQYAFSSPPTAVGGIVYDGGAGSGGTLYATDESSGALLWHQSVANGDNSSPAVDANNVYVTYPDNYYAFNRLTGAQVWQDALGGDGGGGRTPVVADGHLFIRDWTASALILSAATGATQGPLGSATVPAVAGGNAYEMSSGTLQAVTSDGLGTVRWSFAGDGHLTSAPVVTSNAAWVGSSSGMLYALNCTTGQPIWSTNVGSGIYAPDEQNVSQPLTGLGVGGNTLVVPAGSTLVAYTSSSTTGSGSCGAYNPSSGGSGGSSGSGSGQSSAPASSPQTAASSGTTRAATSRPTARTRAVALLQRDLLLKTTVRRLLATQRLTLRLAVPGAGRLALAWAMAPVGVKTKHPVLIALVLKTKRAGTGTVILRLDRTAIRMLRRARRGLMVAGAAQFKPTRGSTARAKRAFRLRAR